LAVADLEESVAQVKAHEVAVEPIRTDEGTGKRFVFSGRSRRLAD
jgi:hypothetical protein